jgi:hypothetical protein
MREVGIGEGISTLWAREKTPLLTLPQRCRLPGKVAR